MVISCRCGAVCHEAGNAANWVQARGAARKRRRMWGGGGGTGELGGVMLVTRDRAAQCRINGKPARKVRDCCTAERIDATDAGIKSMG